MPENRRDCDEEEKQGMYAIIKTGGKQYKVEEGRFVDVEKITGKVAGDEVSFEALMVVDGEDVKIGNPTVEGVIVKGEVLAEGKGKKVITFKLRPKTNSRRKKGHRQPYMRIKIVSIG